MKLKMTQEEVQALLFVLQRSTQAKFATNFEAKICNVVLRQFTLKLMKRAMDLQEKVSIELTDQQLLALDYVLPLISTENDFETMLQNRLILQINPACISL